MQTEPIHSLECLSDGWTYFEKKRNPLSQYAPHPWGCWIPLAFRPFTVKRTHYFVKLVSPEVSKAAVQEVVKECEECQSIDPAPISWKVGMDVTHFEGRHYLTLIDCGPSRFVIWRPLLCQDSASIVQQLETILREGCLLSYSQIMP